MFFPNFLLFSSDSNKMSFKIIMKCALFFPLLFSVTYADAVCSFDKLESYIHNQTEVTKINVRNVMNFLKQFENDALHTHAELQNSDKTLRSLLLKNNLTISLKEKLKTSSENGKDMSDCYQLLNEKLFELAARLDKQIYTKIKNLVVTLQVVIPRMEKKFTKILRMIDEEAKKEAQECKKDFPVCSIPGHSNTNARITQDDIYAYKFEFDNLKQQVNNSLSSDEITGELMYAVIKPVKECSEKK